MKAAILQSVQAFLNLFQAPRYLEIDVRYGKSLHSVSASRKVAVDPVFLFDIEAAGEQHRDTEYYPMRSDDFFASYVGPAFDVVLIDGLHTSEQTLRDLMNVLAHVRRNSVIIIDDIAPSSYAASLPSREDMILLKAALGDPDVRWMGDVYRLAYFLETFLQSYSFASTEGHKQQLVLWRQARANVPERTLSQVGSVDFLDFVKDRALLRTQPLDQIVAAAKAAGVGDGPGAESG